MIRQVFCGSQSQTLPSLIFFFEAPKWLPHYFKWSISTNNEKSMSSHVLRNLIRMARRTVNPFILLDAHNPKEVSTSKQNVPKAREKIFNGTEF